MFWRLPSKDNILLVLIDVGHERVATYYMDEYEKFSDWDFFFHCVETERQFFLKHALRRQYFDIDYMHR